MLSHECHGITCLSAYPATASDVMILILGSQIIAH